ncbi:MAG: hypothetical protein JRI34_12480, partial [Deltaproteobacteria bacterium]|nr:hypothetical protein [Deltaproteobacteria bacterium]
GFLVNRIDASAQKAGTHKVEWDGTNYLGQTLPDGTYTFEVIASNPDGSRVNTTSYIEGEITGLTFDETGSPVPLINGIGLNLASIIEINNPKLLNED